jgi:tRNA(Ile)-lysidine synthase
VSELRRQIESTIGEQHLLAAGEAVLVGVSGGVDSMVLLHILHGLARSHGWRLVIGHFNHQLRGRSSDADERFIRAAGKRLGLKVKVGRADVRAAAARHGISIEMAARQLRHGFLARAAASLDLKKVALAHQADDQVELFFLRLLRGAGPEGLAGMKWLSPSPANPDVRLIRPLLGVWRRELETFAREQGLGFRHDASNDRLNYERNRIRHELLPWLREKFQPALSRTVWRLMTILSAESDFIAQKTREAQSESKSEGALDYSELPPALQRRWLCSEALALGVAPDFDLIEHWRRTPGDAVMVNPDLSVVCDPAGHLHARKPVRSEFKTGHRVVDLSRVKGRVTFENCRILWAVRRWRGWPEDSKTPPSGVELFDADKIGASIRLRHWQPSDRFQPIGMAAPVKLQNLFTNLKIPRSRRLELVLAETAGGEIFWVEGLRISDRFKIDESTRRCLRWARER